MGILRSVIYDEVTTCANHENHAHHCNCERTTQSILQRMRSDPAMVMRFFDQEGLLPKEASDWRLWAWQ